jgi:hypothetical protein
LFLGIDGRDRATVAWMAGFRALALTTVESGASDRFAPEAPPRTHVLDQAPLEDLQVLTDARGRQIAVWWTGDPLAAGRIMAARRDRGEAFSPAQAVAMGRRLTGLDAALGAGGRAGATWSAQGRQHPVFAALASSAEAWRKPQTLTAPGRSGEQPQIEIDGEGRAVALWGGLQGMRAATASARSALSGRGLISARRLCSSTQLVMAPSGKAVATFICNRPRRYQPPWSDVPLPLHEVARYQP